MDTKLCLAMRKCAAIGLVMVVSAAVAVENIYGNDGYKWTPSGDGPYYWNDSSNWEEGHQPTSFQAAIFDAGGTVKIPAATAESPFTEGSLFFPRVDNFPRGDKLTIDGSGTYWLKMADATDTIQTWNYLNLVDFGGYFWGGEGHNQAYADDAAEFLATDVVLEIERAGADEDDGATLTLKQGFLNFYDPLGEGHTAHGHNFNLFQTGRSGAKVIYEDGTHTRTRAVTVRVNATNQLFWVKGGKHEVFNGFMVKSTDNQYPGLVKITGGSLEVMSGDVNITYANRKANVDYAPVGRVSVSGEGVFSAVNSNFNIASGNGPEGYLDVSGNAKVLMREGFVANNENGKGEINISGNSTVSLLNHLWLARAINTKAVINMDGGMLALQGVLVCGNAATARTELNMTGGTVSATNDIWFGNASYSTNILHMTGGEIEARSTLQFNRADNSYGEYYIGGNAKVDHSVGGTMYIGLGSDTDTDVVVGDNADLTGYIWMGNNGASTAHSNSRLIVTNNAALHWRGGHMTLGMASTNRIIAADNATLDIRGTVEMGWRNDSNCLSELICDGNMKFMGTGAIGVGTGSNAAKCRAYFRGGSSLSECGDVNINGRDSVIEVSGGDWLFHHLYVYQSAGYDTFTNVFRVTGGKIRFNDWTVIGNNSQMGSVDVSGGEFSTREINLGFANQASDQMCVMRVSGTGIVEVENGTGDSWFQLGSGTGNASRGRLEQVGGEIRTHSIRGYHSAAGRSEAFFDGGKITQITKVHNNYGIIQGLTEAKVGATGLTIDSNGFSSYVNQAFTDADDDNGGTVEGRVTVTGNGSLDVRLDSTHALTVVDGGTLTFSNGATVFGRRTVLKNGGAFSLAGDATTFAFDNLTIGDATSAGVLKLDAGDTITITGADGLEVNNLVLDVSHITDNGNYTIFQSSGDGTIDPAKIGNVTLKVADPLKTYTLNADGTMTVADRVLPETQWLGTQSSLWNNNDNWSANAPSTADTKAVFGAVGNRNVQTSSGAIAGVLEFTAPNYVVYGSDAVSVGIAIENQSTAGTVTMASPLALGENVSIIGAAGSTTALSGALSGADVSLTKTGSGKVEVSGSNAGLDAAWTLDGGTLDFASEGSFGTGDKPVEVVSGTLAYGGESAATASGSLLVNAATGVGAIVDTAGDLTFTNAEVRSGRMVKKGAGTLSFDLGAGTYPFADVGDVRVGNNIDEITTDIAFNASGDSQSSSVSANMFYPLTVAEGRLVFSGAGSNATTVVHRNGLSIGDTYAGAQANSELVLKNVFFDNANVDAFIVVGRKVNSSANAEPWLKVLDGAYLYAHKMWIGRYPSVQSVSGLAVTNSTVLLNSRMSFGGGANATGVLRVGPGGKVQVNDSFDFRGKTDILVEGEGAEMSAPNTSLSGDRWGWSGILQFEDWNGSGTIAIKNGGLLTVGAHIHGSNYGVNGTTSPGLRFVFDGGTLKFLSNGTSMMARPQYQYALTEGAGMTVSVAEGAVQKLTFPIRGNGGLVKTGGGELVFADVRDFTKWDPQIVIDGLGYFNLQYNETDMMLGQYEGTTEVREGILTLYAGMLTNTTAVTVGEAGALNLGGNEFEFPSVEGTGVISNGTLNAVVKVALDNANHTGAAPAFSDVTLPANQMFEFDCDGEIMKHVPYTLSEMGCTVEQMTAWRATFNGQRFVPEFSLDGSGRTVVTFRMPPGTTILIR